MLFAQIPGIQSVKDVLTQAVANQHIAHAQLFLGAEGALNLPLALAYATYLHCENRKENDACGQCAACSKSLKYIHPDTHFVFPMGNLKANKDEEAQKIEKLKWWRSFLLENPLGNIEDWANHYGGEDKQLNISKEESREIIKTLALKSFESKVKVMIIWQPEYMHPTAANGILKILEEPTPNTYFILITNAADRLLPTIISRTQIITVPLLQDDELENYLITKKGIDEKRAAQITQLADGNINQALRLLAREEDDNTQRFTAWMRACYRREFISLLAMADDFHNLDKISQKNLFSYSLNLFRETLLNLSGATGINRTRGEELKFVQDFSKVLDWKKIETGTKLINEAIYHLERNGSAKMIFLDLSIQLHKTFQPK